METIIEKTGDAFIYIGITRTKKLKDSIPPEAVVNSLLPGLSFFAVGVFKYDSISDIRPGNEKYSWKDCFDTTIQVPIDLYNTKKLFFIKRLYNTNNDIVNWAKGDYLKKIPSNVLWQENKNAYTVSIERIDGKDESIEMKGKKRVRLPNFFWKIPPLKAIAAAFLVSKYDDQYHTFQGILEFEKSHLGTASCTVSGVTLPKPLFSLSVFIKNYNPLHIKPIMKLYHTCSYGEQKTNTVKSRKKKKAAI
ncbi:MAG: hypothetical protein GY754_31230 [bacterium]|nr:hypothetical protein [bacterium]